MTGCTTVGHTPAKLVSQLADATYLSDGVEVENPIISMRGVTRKGPFLQTISIEPGRVTVDPENMVTVATSDRLFALAPDSNVLKIANDVRDDVEAFLAEVEAGLGYLDKVYSNTRRVPLELVLLEADQDYRYKTTYRIEGEGAIGRFAFHFWNVDDPVAGKRLRTEARKTVWHEYVHILNWLEEIEFTDDFTEELTANLAAHCAGVSANGWSGFPNSLVSAEEETIDRMKAASDYAYMMDVLLDENPMLIIANSVMEMTLEQVEEDAQTAGTSPADALLAMCARPLGIDQDLIKEPAYTPKRSVE